MAPMAVPFEMDDFHFYPIMEQTEELTFYVPGGYHPTIIGDVLRPPGLEPESATTESKSQSVDVEESLVVSREYRIMHKLGFGSYSTVWLAQKTDSSNAFVAVKITMAEDDGPVSREAAMLEAASRMIQDDEGKRKGSHILTLLDHFTLHGPNGTHSVLVTDIVVPMPSLISYKHPPAWYKIAARGLVKAVADLHSAGIVHGDLHLGNIGSAMPHIADQNPELVMQRVGAYDITIVLPVSAAKKTSSLPDYILTPCNLAAYYQKIAVSTDLPHTKIFDFGNAHEAGTLPLNFQCAAEACAPELAFARVVEGIDNPPVEPPADVWALGAAIYEMVARTELFYFASLSSLPRRMAAMTDSLPSAWQEWYSKLPNAPEVSAQSADAWWEKEVKVLRKNCEDEASVEALVKLLRQVLVLDPAKRPSAAEVLCDPWFYS